MVLALRYENDALGRPFHVGAYRMVPGRNDSFPHRHIDFHEIMGVVDGTGERLLETGAVRLQPGDAVLVRSSDVHSMRGDPPAGLAILNVTFPTSVWQGFFLGLTDVDSFAFLGDGEAAAAVAPPVGGCRSRGRSSRCSRRRTSSTRPRSHCSAPVPLLARPVRAGAAVSGGRLGRRLGRPPWLVAVCRAMRREESLRGGVPRMLELARVSAGYLSRSMRTHYGTTPTAFVVDIRLERAAALLADTTEPIATISAALRILRASPTSAAASPPPTPWHPASSASSPSAASCPRPPRSGAADEGGRFLRKPRTGRCVGDPPTPGGRPCGGAAGAARKPCVSGSVEGL